MTKSKINPGDNAHSFSEHIICGLEAAGVDFDGLHLSYVSHKDDPNKIGFGLLQVKDDVDTFVACFEDGLHFGNSETVMICDERQPASKLAILILVSILSGRPVHAPECPCCTEEV